MARLLNVLLFVVIGVGVVMLVGQRVHLHELLAEHGPLAHKYGVMEIKDDSKFYVRRIKGEEPDFVWRVYRPQVTTFERHTETALSGSGYSSDRGAPLQAREDVYRAHFELTDDEVALHWIVGDTGGQTPLAPLAKKLFADHYDELEFRIAEDGEHDSEEPLILLGVHVPEPLLKKLVDERPFILNQLKEAPLVEISIGTTPAYERRQAQREAQEVQDKQQGATNE